MTRLAIVLHTGQNGVCRNMSPQLEARTEAFLREAGVTIPEIRTLAAVLAHRHNRRPGKVSRERLAVECGVSRDTTKRHLAALVKKGALVALSRPTRNSITQYDVTDKLRWDKGLGLFVPRILNTLGLEAHELWAYLMFVKRAKNATGVFFVEGVAQTGRELRMHHDTAARSIRRLQAFGMIKELGANYYELCSQNAWAKPEQLADLRSRADNEKGTFQPQEEDVWDAPSDVWDAPSNVWDAPSNVSEMPPISKPLVIQPITQVVKDNIRKSSTKETPDAMALLGRLLGSNLSGWLAFAARQGSSATQVIGAINHVGLSAAEKAWQIIQTTPPLRTVDQTPYASGQRFYDFLFDKLEGRRECHALCELRESVKRAEAANREAAMPQPTEGDIVHVKDVGALTVTQVFGRQFEVVEVPDAIFGVHEIVLPPTAAAVTPRYVV